MDAANLTPSYQGSTNAWRGVLKCEGRVVWVCRHLHHNRDQSSRTNGQSALACAMVQASEIQFGKEKARIHHMGGYAFG
jgi:nitric oxide synthase oxygenase domain/subunit